MYFYRKFILIVAACFGVLLSIAQIRVGAECYEDYLPELQAKKVALVVNHTSLVGNEHLIDFLLRQGIDIVKIFTPEHGFLGKSDAGEAVSSSTYTHERATIISLYGRKKKPLPTDMEGIDIVVYDMQDVGARFYTYISTMHNVMEACAEQNIPCMILDRPNPNGFYVDGPILNLQYSSFVGMHPVPIVHGMTVAEYARMIVGEKWLAGGVVCDLKYVLCDGYDHSMRYVPPVAPSPNLPNITAINLYPVLCLTEGTVLSCGRGTDFPFQVIGHPALQPTGFTFTPRSIVGASKYPPLEGLLCNAIDLREYPIETITEIPLEIFIDAYKKYTGEKYFFTHFFLKITGTDKLSQQIRNELSVQEIRNTWKKDLDAFKKIRKKYLLYNDF